MGSGAVTTITGYIGNRFLHMAEKLEITEDFINWSFYTLPEFFIGAAGARIIDYGLKKLSENKKYEKLKDFSIRAGITAASILGPGILHELGPNGINHTDDVIKYCVGIGLSTIVNACDHIQEKKYRQSKRRTYRNQENYLKSILQKQIEKEEKK